MGELADNLWLDDPMAEQTPCPRTVFEESLQHLDKLRIASGSKRVLYVAYSNAQGPVVGAGGEADDIANRLVVTPVNVRLISRTNKCQHSIPYAPRHTKSLESFTVSPFASDAPNDSQRSLWCKPDSGVPLSALKVLPQPLHW